MESSRKAFVSPLHVAIETVVIAALYVVLAKVGQLLAIPPGNVTLLWPPSGVAFAAFILLGWRSAAGIFLGAAISNVISVGALSADLNAAAIMIPFAIGAGSALQPWFGRLLWRRARNAPGFLANPRNALAFIIVAPVMCLVSSSIGSLSLLGGGAIEADALFDTWATWWLGDTVGVLVFAPMVMALFRMARLRALALIALILAGFGLTYVASHHLRTEGEGAWREKADLASNRLSETLLLWLDLSYASVNSIAVLFHGSDFVSEDEFLDAVDGLESSGVTSLPASVGFIDDTAAGDAGPWRVVYSTDQSGIAAQGAVVIRQSLLGTALATSKKRPGQLVLEATPASADGGRRLMVMMYIDSGEQKGGLFAVIEIGEMAAGLFEKPGTAGLALRLAGNILTASGDVRQQYLIGADAKPALALATFELRSISADTELSFYWDVFADFDGGPDLKFADLALIGGIVGTVLLSLLLVFVFAQNEAIAERVRERTAELAEKTSLMEAIMGSMGQGIAAFDADLKLIAANQQFKDVRDYPDALIFDGQDFENLIRYDIERQEFGDGDPEELLAQKISLAEAFAPHSFERRRPNGSYIEVQGGPLPGGGFVSTYTDITGRKQTEARIAAQVAELDDARRATLNMMADAELARKRAEALRADADAARQHLQAALDNMTDGIYMLDADLCFQLFNEKYRDLVDLPPDAIEMGRSVENTIRAHAERGDYGNGDIDEIVAERMEKLANGEAGELSMVIDGGEKYLELKKAPTDQGGAVVIIADATNRTKAQNALSSALSVISESIDYASNIQRSILPSGEIFDSIMSDYFVIWEPRDVVGGDMYWCDIWGDGILIVLGDCTGHGVPGAFMTLIADGAIERAKSDTVRGDVAKLLQNIHQTIQISLGQHRAGGASDDGIDLGVCYVNSELSEMAFAGAHFSLFVFEGDEVEEIKGTRRGLGYRGVPLAQEYGVQTVKIDDKKTFVMTSDGLLDQIGGEKRRGFGKRRFKHMMLAERNQPLGQQKDRILQALADYQGEEIRRDDVSLIGFRF